MVDTSWATDLELSKFNLEEGKDVITQRSLILEEQFAIIPSLYKTS